MKRSWNNFRAYYNTFYNAENSFEAGMQKVHEHTADLNPLDTYRVHPAPVNVAEDDFEKVIQKGARILNKHPNSKYIDEMLGMIGQAYYYRHQFFSALQKFEEQQEITRDPLIRQQAAIWKARVLMDLERYEEGILYLQERLEVMEQWTDTYRAEAQVMLAELNAQLERWEEAETMLNSAIPALQERKFKARTYFLYGQVLENLERYGEAFFAYSQAASNYPTFNYLYWSERKKAEVSFASGDTEIALQIYTRMRNDDKNVDQRHELDYEIARIHQQQGDYLKAEQIFKRILRDAGSLPGDDLRGPAYYQLGRIYSEYHKNYKIATAYFDSSQAATRSGEHSPLAEAYGTYSTLKQQIAYKDSLLWLASLSGVEFDSVLQIIRAQKLKERSGRTEQGRLMSNDPVTRNAGTAVGSSQFGFLNHNNKVMLERAKDEFRAFWGNRPLTDNWRRAEALPGNISAAPRSTESNATRKTGRDRGGTVEPFELDLNEIPNTADEKDHMRRQIAEDKLRLANIFYLTFDNPDSALVYYRSVVEDYNQPELKAKALYSMFEIKLATHAMSEAEELYGQLQETFPESDYTERAADRLRKMRDPSGLDPKASEEITEKYHKLKNTIPDSSLDKRVQHIEDMRSFALANRYHPVAPHAHFDVILEYLQIAKSHTDSAGYASYWASKLPASESISTGDQGGGVGGVNPFRGVYWDSVRVLLDEYSHTFEPRPHAQRIENLKVLLSTEGRSDQLPASIPTCLELGVEPKILPDRETFKAKVSIPDQPEAGLNVGEIRYELVIDRQGEVEAYRLRSPIESADMKKTIDLAIENFLKFSPILHLG
ncbi:MAG: tetratricopeptide repeat protein, partial [Balneolaceae bacterium]|nr:tetratricopeptide repeat protein [Balneolaceae bacterium]